MTFRIAILTGLVLLNMLAVAQKNVLFIVADDLNCSIGPYGDRTAITPNLDRLAQRGLTFHRAYCQQAVCNPSRSSFLTGKLPDATGVDDLRKSFRAALPDVVTLPQAFLQAGYFTQCIGKIFHNMGPTKDRVSWSVDEYLFEGTHAADTVYAQQPKPKAAPSYKAPATESLTVPATAYRDGRITERAVEALRRMPEKGKPFFLAVGYWRPHLPFVAPKQFWDLYDPNAIPLPNPSSAPARVPSIALHSSSEIRGYGGIPEGPISEQLLKHLRHGYYASISFLDDQVGQLLDALEASRATKDTLIVFTSDHGFHIGEHDLWGKTSNFELDARVPFILADPSKPRSHGKGTDALAELLDLIPTLTALAPIPSPREQHGVNLAPILEDPNTSLRTHARTQHQRPFYGRNNRATHWGYSLRSDRWRYTEWRNIETKAIDARELYDHHHDPLETSNVQHAHPEIVATLSQQLPIAFQLIRAQ